MAADVEPGGMLRLSQHRLFVLLGVLAVGAIAVLRGEALWDERSRVLEQRQAQASALTEFVATRTARLYDQAFQVTGDVAELIRSDNPSDATLHRYLAERVQDTGADDYVVVLDADGRIRATSEDPQPSTLRYDPRGPTSWRSGDKQILPAMRSRLTGSVIYPLSERLEDGSGRFIGVVSVNIRPENVRGVATRKADEPQVSLWAQDGRFIAANFLDFDAEGRAIAPLKPSGLGIAGSAQVRAGQVVSASKPLQGWPIVAVTSFDRDGVLQDWRRSLYGTIALIAFAALGIGALVWLGVRTAQREALAKTGLQEANAVAAEALKRRDLLMREVDHRVKNSLMMTASLLQLQERRFSDPDVREAFESTRHRLNSIGLVHEALYQGSSLEEVDLQQYIKRLLDELASAYGAETRGIRVEMDIAPLSLASHQTTPVGLIVAEVVTNAFKHAFGEQGAGTLTVRARLVNLDDIEIEIRDDGAGYATARPAEAGSGLGTRLITALTQQLNGTLSLANEGGAAFRLTFPRLTRAEPIRH